MATLALPETGTATWTIDPVHSAVEFKVRHMMVTNVKGHFTGLQGTLTLDERDVSRSRVTATIDAGSVSTREPQRDAHLRSADFFDVEQFPVLSFTSTRIDRSRDGGLTVAGDLTIHGITREVVFTVDGPTAPHKDLWGNVKIGAAATTVINRKDFGLTWNAVLETGGFAVGEDVTITLDLEFNKA